MPESRVFWYGDNLQILREHVEDASVDLVYLDPPFNSQRSYLRVFKEADGTSAGAQRAAFEDTWAWGPEAERIYEALTSPEKGPREGALLARTIAMLRAILGTSDLFAYLVMMAVRLVEMRRVLKPTGSLYLHCDPTASHYLKLVLDALFGGAAFQNEIIWQRSTGKALQTRRLPNNHDVILSYRKGDGGTWNLDETFIPYDHDALDARTLSQYAHRDDDGRRYTLGDLVNPNADRPNLTYEFLGIERVWRWTKSRMLAAHRDGLIVQSRPGAVPRLKRYLDEQRGKPFGDVWTDIPPISSHAKERINYPTQKPLALLQRILRMASKKGDLVLDPFCGCGTTVEAAESLGRKWIGIDRTHLAVSALRARLEAKFPALSFRVRGEPEDVVGARTLAHANPWEFQAWIVDRVGGVPLDPDVAGSAAKRRADAGLDGLLSFRDDPKARESKRMILSVKTGPTLTPGMVRDLRGAMLRAGAPMGAMLTAYAPNEGVRKEASAAGWYRAGTAASNAKFPAIQVLSVEEILAGKSLRGPGLRG